MVLVLVLVPVLVVLVLELGTGTGLELGLGLELGRKGPKSLSMFQGLVLFLSGTRPDPCDLCSLTVQRVALTAGKVLPCMDDDDDSDSDILTSNSPINSSNIEIESIVTSHI